MPPPSLPRSHVQHLRADSGGNDDTCGVEMGNDSRDAGIVSLVLAIPIEENNSILQLCNTALHDTPQVPNSTTAPGYG